MYRKNPLVSGEIYHIFNRSIAEYQIFNNEKEFLRMIHLISFYRFEKITPKFSEFYRTLKRRKQEFFSLLEETTKNKEKLIQIIAYCIMPTHFHLILRQIKDNGISTFMSNILSGYSHYFNITHKRKGPLYESRFNSILIQNDTQLLHLTRYVHLNPVTAHLTEKAEEWKFSSYDEYLKKKPAQERICYFNDLLKIDPERYAFFVNDRKDYQRELANIKKLIIDFFPFN